MPRVPDCRAIVASTLVSLAAIIVSAPGSASNTSIEAGTDGAPTVGEAARVTYSGLFDSGPVTFVDGRWEGEPFVEGGASAPRAGLVGHFLLQGDLDGDGMRESVVLLWTSSGGSGTFDYLAVLDRGGDGSVVNRATFPLGDRVRLRSGTIADGRVVVDLVQAGPDDAACCPGQKVRRTLALEGGTLTESGTEDQGRLGMADLSGQWTLTHFGRDESVGSHIDITLTFDGAAIGGRSACNRYSGRVSAGDMPGDLSTAGPLVSTRMACRDELMQAEHRYLQSLANLRAFSFVGGRLVLTWSDGAESGSLMFERATGAGSAD